MKCSVSVLREPQAIFGRWVDAAFCFADGWAVLVGGR